MSALRVARGFTKRDITIKFEGCYHGHVDSLLVKAGSGVATFGIPGSAGVPEEVAHLTLALPYNDLNPVEYAFAAHPGQIAAVILEPVVGNAGCILPKPGFLEGLRALTRPVPVTLHVDSQYVMQGITSWLAGWKRNGWRTSTKQPVKNQDLWQALDAELGRHQVRWVWVKGHAGDPGNEKADELANRGVPRG